MLLISHFKTIIDQRIKIFAGSYFLITNINLSGKTRYIDIYPPVSRLIIKESCVFSYIGINRIFKCIRIAGLIKLLIFFFREIYFKISLFLSYCIIAVASHEVI